MKTRNCFFLLLLTGACISSVWAKDKAVVGEPVVPEAIAHDPKLERSREPSPTLAAFTELAKSAEQELRGNILPFWDYLVSARKRAEGGCSE